MPRRSLLLHGLRLTLARPAALLWAYAFNLAIALLFSLRLHAQLASILDHSLAAQRLTSAFNLATLLNVSQRLSHDAPSTGATSYLGLPLYLLLYFLLVPGALAAYNSPARLSLAELLRTGLAFFWRFIRITLLTLLLSAAILAPLLLLHNAVSSHIDSTTVGLNALLLQLPTLLLLAFAAATLRLYFDLVEVYTIQLNSHLRANQRTDKRIRRTLLPAFHTLRRNFTRAWLTFILLALLGLAALALTTRAAAHTLAQPRVSPLFLLTQLGLFLMLFTRFYQRAALTILAQDNPLAAATQQQLTATHSSQPHRDEWVSSNSTPYPSLSDPRPNPEPIAPSLPAPDPAVFHHEIPASDPLP